VKQKILINDLGLGLTHKGLWRYALEQHFEAQIFELQYLSSLPLIIPANWQVKPEVVLPLAAKLWAFQQQAFLGQILYLEGNLLCQGNLAELFNIKSPGWLQAPQNLPISRWSLFRLDCTTSQRVATARQLEQLTAKSYRALAEFNNLDSQPLPQQWCPVPFGENPTANLIDCRAMGERPWYCAFAPSSKLWAAQLRCALEQGYLSLNDIAEDVAAGLVRPSLLRQIELAIDNPFDLPVAAIEADRTFVLPEFAVAPEQRQMVDTTIFPFPRRELHRLLLSPKYLFQFELPHQMARIKSICQKIPVKFGLGGEE
jgi:hypothetical protein